MLSVASLLNPEPAGHSVHQYPPTPASTSPATSFADDIVFFDRPVLSRAKKPKDFALFTKGEAKGVVNFQPFESLNKVALREIQKYQVAPFGSIQQYCRHIPYNSGKKDFFEKTGRESFEVFQYTFRVPDDNAEYVVMWDYNIGLVRMTPFFKCCRYPKTTPAKMLNLNPGLKEITHSITGGSIIAQGYWMPYLCAKAICTTFCHHIAGALIPIFGPGFPSQCIPPEAPDHGRMIIDPSVIISATREAEYFHRLYSSIPASVVETSPTKGGRAFRDAYDDSRYYGRHRVRESFLGCKRPYGTDMGGGFLEGVDHIIQDRLQFAKVSSSHSPQPRSGWTPVNTPNHKVLAPSPWLSALPYSPGLRTRPSSSNSDLPKYPQRSYPGSPAQRTRLWRLKRLADYGYETRVDGSAGRHAIRIADTKTSCPIEDQRPEPTIAPDRNAALLLMNLSVRDSAGSKKGKKGGGAALANLLSADDMFPRVKRSRANSM